MKQISFAQRELLQVIKFLQAVSRWADKSSLQHAQVKRRRPGLERNPSFSQPLLGLSTFAFSVACTYLLSFQFLPSCLNGCVDCAESYASGFTSGHVLRAAFRDREPCSPRPIAWTATCQVCHLVVLRMKPCLTEEPAGQASLHRALQPLRGCYVQPFVLSRPSRCG